MAVIKKLKQAGIQSLEPSPACHRSWCIAFGSFFKVSVHKAPKAPAHHTAGETLMQQGDAQRAGRLMIHHTIPGAALL